jgi:hypothetical protein
MFLLKTATAGITCNRIDIVRLLLGKPLIAMSDTNWQLRFFVEPIGDITSGESCHNEGTKLSCDLLCRAGLIPDCLNLDKQYGGIDLKQCARLANYICSISCEDPTRDSPIIITNDWLAFRLKGPAALENMQKDIVSQIESIFYTKSIKVGEKVS